MSQQLEIALGQMTSVDNVEQNYLKIQKLVSDAFAKGRPRIIFFPENCLYFRIQEGAKIPAFDLGHNVFRQLERLAAEKDIYLHLGSVPLSIEDKVYNSSVLVTPQGESRATYQKIHLFDIELTGSKPIRESDVFSAGMTTSTFEVDGFKFGESICYDIRFAELYEQYAKAQVDSILIPAAFLVPTGEAHWHVLNRARAIESQCYVLSAAQAGVHQGAEGGVRKTFGHSLAISPWGVVMGELDGQNEGVVLSTLEKSKVEEVRRQIPMKQHRRL